MVGDWGIPTRVVFGAGRVRELPDLVRSWGKQALIVTDRGVKGSGALQPVLDALSVGDIDFRVFEGVEPNPTEENIHAGVRRFQEECDFLIAVGGGSPIDAAKAIRLAATHEGPLAQYDDLKGGDALIRPGMPPMVAIPTTAGTGSEVGRSTVVTIDGRKTVIFSPYLLPEVALLDPELTRDLPERMTAGTGADALTHNFEAYFSKGFNPICDAIALDGMRRAARWLAIAVQDGQNIEARSEMLVASMMGAVAFQKGLGATHSLAHPLSSVAGVHHGTANAIMLPHVVRFNREVIAPRAEAAAVALGISPSTDPLETVDRIAEGLHRLFESVGLPTRLHQVNVTSALICPMVELAFADGCHQCNPRPVTREDLEALYRAAL